ncbi:hypothetical protein DMC30DRAFT_355562 [Rhodotorula diobovata]|uniref:RING-type domain-containing protein n=1 Tax=Rhodotorula diobovata TaxID=5288 RepID=A0A5C5FR51_9BASI|nr:hypothetical protein DMC30DRAFT_355562 [Rhodotorula diobovata]
MSTSSPPTLSPVAVGPPLRLPGLPSADEMSSRGEPHSFPPGPRQDDRDDDDDDDDDEPQADVDLPPAAAVRLSVGRRLLAATSDLQGVRRIRLAFFAVLGLAQIIAFSVILGMHYSDQCDTPLAPYLVMVIVRIAAAFPPYFWLTISPPRPNRRDPDAVRAALAQNRHVGSLAIDHRVRRVADLISVYSVVLFVLGNWWVISATSCQADSPTLYRGAVAALVLSWLYVAEILVWAVLVIFFLPFVLIGARWFGVGQKKNEIGPLKKDDIASLPQRVFVGTLPDDPSPAASDPAPASDAASPPPASAGSPSPVPVAASAHPTKPRRQLWRLWRRRRAKAPSSPGDASANAPATQVGAFAPLPAGVEPLRLPESQAACAICLCEYDLPPLRDSPEAASWQPERLALLPCGHAFHTECLGDWLALSGRCPLCQRDLHAPKKRRTRRNGGAAPSGSGGEASGAAGTDERV